MIGAVLEPPLLNRRPILLRESIVPRILTFVDYYLPGYKAGGPIRSVSNLVDWLGTDIDFSIVTSDRDLGDTQPYGSVSTGQWTSVKAAQVFYLSPKLMATWQIYTILVNTSYDVVYLNSYFAIQTIQVLLLRRLKCIPLVPVIVAPRGEFSPGALTIKQNKKCIFMRFAQWLGLYDGVIWHATSEDEAREISCALDMNECSPHDTVIDSIIVAPNLPTSADCCALTINRQKDPGTLRVVYLSRISEKKNLFEALKILALIPGNLIFDIYGPVENSDYWAQCKVLMNSLPRNIKATYKGSIPNERSVEMLQQYHLFFLPTKGENFGHAIVEALQQGCPVLISDRTPWHNLTESKAGWDLPLEDTRAFVSAICQALEMDNSTFAEWSESSRKYIERLASPDSLLAASRQLFSYFQSSLPGPR